MQKVEEVFAKADKQQERASIHSRLPTLDPGNGPEQWGYKQMSAVFANQ